jgi:rod shape-determining protein MreD
MAAIRVLLVGVLLFTALLLQLTVLPLLGLPGATPDLLLVTVAALGLVGGPVKGSLAGFAAGLALDVVPPADGILGLSAVVLTVVGYLGGELGERRDRAALLTTGYVGLMAGGAVIGYAFLGGIVSDPRVDWARVPMLALTSALYAAVLAAFVVPGVAAMVRRLEPPESGYGLGRVE